MENSYSQLTVLFEDGVWSGYFEHAGPDGYRAARHVFGAEPGEADIREFILSVAYARLNWTETMGPRAQAQAHRENPKRRMREIAAGMRDRSHISKAQEALKADLEERKREGKARRRLKRERASREAFEERRVKRREKRRGH